MDLTTLVIWLGSAFAVFVGVAGPLFWMDRKAYGGMSVFARRRVRRLGVRAPAVVLDESPVRGEESTVVIVEVRPMEGAPFRVEIRCEIDRHELPPGYGGEDSRRNELSKGKEVHVFFVPGDQKRVILDVEEMDRRLDAIRVGRAQEKEGRKAAKAEAHEARRQKLLKGDGVSARPAIEDDDD